MLPPSVDVGSPWHGPHAIVQGVAPSEPSAPARKRVDRQSAPERCIVAAPERCRVHSSDLTNDTDGAIAVDTVGAVPDRRRITGSRVALDRLSPWGFVLSKTGAGRAVFGVVAPSERFAVEGPPSQTKPTRDEPKRDGLITASPARRGAQDPAGARCRLALAGTKARSASY